MLSRCATCAVVTPASTTGRHPEEEDSEVVGRSGAPHLAAVPQDGWTGFLRYTVQALSFLSKDFKYF